MSGDCELAQGESNMATVIPPYSDKQTRLRIGAVSYLNSKPLVEGLAEADCAREFRLELPSRLADELSEGVLDVALIPSVEYFRDADYEIVSDACVAAHGPVMSVKLYTRKPWGKICTVAMDVGSRTSAALSRAMLKYRFGVEPQIVPFPLNTPTEQIEADAVLMIGDRAMFEPSEQFQDVWDLGQEWLNWAGLPFVFAMWVTRREVEAPELGRLLSHARDCGVEQIEQIAATEGRRLGLDQDCAVRYLRDHLNFQLGSAERHGLKVFADLAVETGLISNDCYLRFRD